MGYLRRPRAWGRQEVRATAAGLAEGRRATALHRAQRGRPLLERRRAVDAYRDRRADQGVPGRRRRPRRGGRRLRVLHDGLGATARPERVLGASPPTPRRRAVLCERRGVRGVGRRGRVRAPHGQRHRPAAVVVAGRSPERGVVRCKAHHDPAQGSSSGPSGWGW